MGPQLGGSESTVGDDCWLQAKVVSVLLGDQCNFSICRLEVGDTGWGGSQVAPALWRSVTMLMSDVAGCPWQDQSIFPNVPLIAITVS